MNWRPHKNQWEKTRCDLCFENECEGDDCEACREVYEAGASAMLAARDKEWIEWLEVNSNTDAGWIVVNPDRWQNRKKEVK